MKEIKVFILDIVDEINDDKNIVGGLLDKLEELREHFFCKNIEFIRHDYSEDGNIIGILNNIGQGNKVVIIDTSSRNDIPVILKRENLPKIEIGDMAESRREFYSYIGRRPLFSVLPDIEVFTLPSRDMTDEEITSLASEMIEEVNGIYIETLAEKNRKVKNKWLIPAVFTAGFLLSFAVTKYCQKRIKNDVYYDARREGRKGPSYNEAVKDKKKYIGSTVYWPVTAHVKNIALYKGSTRKRILLGNVYDTGHKLHMNMGKSVRMKHILGKIRSFEDGVPVVDVIEVRDNFSEGFDVFIHSIFSSSKHDESQKLDMSYSARDKKLYKSLKSFYEGKYEEAISLAEEVVAANPEDALAWKRLGSGYFILGDNDKAIYCWAESIKYDPNDRKLKSFLKKIKECGKNEDDYKTFGINMSLGESP
ncbi:MAG: tetratricopeptide repeat protein [bacterium]